MSQVTEIKDAINEWAQDRMDGTKAKSLLEKGSFFTITRADFEKWGELKIKPEWIYAYGGDFKGVLKFVLVDSVTAQKPLDESSLEYTFTKSFNRNYKTNSIDFLTNSVKGNITVDDALKRVMRWDIMMDSWIEEQTSDDKKGAPKAFKIPFESLKDSFSNSNVDEVLAVLSLKFIDEAISEDPKYIADIVLWSTSTTKGAGDLKVQNIIYPCPPFCDMPNWP